VFFVYLRIVRKRGPDLLHTFQHGAGMGAGVLMRAARRGNYFPAGAGFGVPLPLHLAGK
jgi:hypothetical protein